MWNSSYALEKLSKSRYTSTKDAGKRPKVVSEAKLNDDLLNASSEEELDKAIESAIQYGIDVIDVLENGISLQKISTSFVELYTNKLEHQKMMEQMKNMRYKLGKGSYGIVYRVSQNKVVKESSKVYKEEVEVLSKLFDKKHKHIQEVFFVQETRAMYEFLYCMIDLKPRCLDLFDLLQELAFDDKLRLCIVFNNNIIEQLYNGLTFLHENNIFHRDLKPENIMVTGIVPNNIIIKIIDFNLSLLLEEGSKFHNYISEPGNIGSITYTSLPYSNFAQYKDKILTGSELKTVQDILKLSDMWSLLIIFWVLVYALHPWESRSTTNYRFRRYILSGDDETNTKISLPPVKDSLIRQALDFDFNTHLCNNLNMLWEFSSDSKVQLRKNIDEFYPSIEEFISKTVQIEV